jgi:hypothetical protein
MEARELPTDVMRCGSLHKKQARLKEGDLASLLLDSVVGRRRRSPFAMTIQMFIVSVGVFRHGGQRIANRHHKTP